MAKSFHTFGLNKDGAGCNSTEENILTNEPGVFAVDAKTVSADNLLELRMRPCRHLEIRDRKHAKR